MSETANLVIKVDSDGVAKADSRLEHISHTSEKAEKASDELVSSLKELAAAYLSVEGAIKFTEKLFDVTKEFQMLSAQIKVAVGDGKDVAGMFEALQEISGKTPFTLKQTVDAFTTLVNHGLEPGQEALESYAKTATALNLTITDVAETVSQASLGQFRGLTQLGIKATEVSDGLVLTFKGTSTKIKKDAEEIQRYIIDLGNTNFGTALTDRSKTLEGAVLDLNKAWDELFISISEKGAGNLISDGIHLATSAIIELRDEIKSGQLVATIKAIGSSFAGWGEDAEHGLNVVIDLSIQAVKILRENFGFVGKGLSDAFTQFPENVRAVVLIVSGAFSSVELQIENIVTFMVKAFTSGFHAVAELATNVGKAIANNMNPFADHFVSFSELIKQNTPIVKSFTDEISNGFKAASTNAEQISAAFDIELDANLKSRDATIESVKVKLQGAKDLREAYEKEKEAREKANEASDPLKGASPSKPIGHINTSEETAAFEALKKSLQLEELSIAESYVRRRELIVNNTKGNNSLQLELLTELDSQVNSEYAKAFKDREDKIISLESELNQAIADGRLSIVDSLRTQLQHEEELVAKSYETRKQMILADTRYTAAQQNALITALDKQRAQSQAEQMRAHQKVQLDQASDFFGNLATISKAFGRKGFEIAKAASIVQATIKTYEAATGAYASQAGIPVIGPALGAVAAAAAIAAGVANVAAIRSQTYSGAYDTGGMIPAGKYGLVGEGGGKGEFVQGPAIITSRRTTADLRQGEGGTSESKGVVINVQNFSGAQVDVQEKDTDTGKQIDLIIKRMGAELVGQIQSGGPVPTALQRVYGLKRGAA